MRIDQLATNQIVVLHDKKAYFFSYETLIAKIEGVGRTGEVFLDARACEYSKTTSKWLYIFLQDYSCINPLYCNKKGIKKLMDKGEIQLLKEEK